MWGPGTFGYFGYDLELFQTYYEPDLDIKRISCNGKEDCDNNGDNFGEGTLDTQYISAMGLSATTLVCQQYRPDCSNPYLQLGEQYQHK